MENKLENLNDLLKMSKWLLKIQLRRNILGNILYLRENISHNKQTNRHLIPVNLEEEALKLYGIKKVIQLNCR